MATNTVKSGPGPGHAAIVAQVRAEAANLPGPAPAWYGQLRRLYWLRRMQTLGRKGGQRLTALECLMFCLAELGKQTRDLPPGVLRDFTELEKGEYD